MYKQILLLCMAITAGWGATLQVCASGCAYSNFQAALNAAQGGDTIELRAGEVFEGAFVLPYRTSGGRITVRSSRWRELPPPGTRLTAAHAPLLPKIQPNDSSVPALTTGATEQYVSSVSVTTDTITFSASHGFANGDPVACWNDDGTIPLVENRVYYARDITANTMKVAAVPGGPVVDLVTAPTATRFRCTIARAVRDWTFQGVEIRKKPGLDSLYSLVEIGTNQETSREGLPTGIHFDRVYIHGLDGENGPRMCVFLSARAFSITDSRIEFCNKEGEEGKALASVMSPGPLLVRNNYISAGSITLLFGGDFVRIENLVNGDSGGILVEGNHFTRPLSTKYTAGTGGTANPTGACSSGAFYLNVATGAWFNCVNSVWAAGPTCANGEYFRRTDVTQSCANGACWSCSGGTFVSSSVYRGSNYYTKNLFEVKNGTNLVVRGNVFENNWVNADQSGVAVWVISQVDQYNANGWVRGENIRFERNVIRNSTQGIRIASTNGAFGVRNNRVLLRDNLLYKIGATDYPSINSTDARPLSLAGPCDDCTVDHNTIVSGVTGGTGTYFDTAPYLRPRLSNNILYRNLYGLLGDVGQPVSYYWGTGNVLNTVAIDNTNQGAGSFGTFAVNGKYISPSTTLFNGGGDYRLQPVSPYSASCTAGCDFAATDGKDLGADIDLVEAATSGATTGAAPGTGLAPRIDAGSRTAVIRYRAPNASSCAVRIYTNEARSALHADTLTAGTQADTRAGSLTDGRRREFVAGTVSLLTESTRYWGLLTCGSTRVPFTFRTTASGATVNQEFRLFRASTARYASDAGFTSPVTLAAATQHLIPVSPGSVVYVQIGSQPATAITGQ